MNFVSQKERSFWSAVFGKLPLKIFTTMEAIKIADSLGGNTSVWYYRIDATGNWLRMQKKDVD